MRVVLSLLAALVSVLITLIDVRAEPPSNIKRIGILYQDPGFTRQIGVFLETLQKLGYIVGKTVTLEPRLAPKAEDLQHVAQEFVAAGVDVLVAAGTPAALAARRVTETIPIVFVVGDPVASGLVTSLGRPGGNATGLATLAGETGAKRLELLKEALPHATRIGVLMNPDNPATSPQIKLIEEAAPRFGFKLRILSARGGKDLGEAFAQASRQQIDALIMIPDPILIANMESVAQRALKIGVPSIFESQVFAKSGGLISYGPSYRDLWRACAVYADKILRGMKPGELPVEQPRVFEVVVNLQTAKALGVTIPESILARADEVIR
jgi:putative ABC transport system substrate-binding protein